MLPLAEAAYSFPLRHAAVGNVYPSYVSDSGIQPDAPRHVGKARTLRRPSKALRLLLQTSNLALVQDHVVDEPFDI
jgi:hypothetical protein